MSSLLCGKPACMLLWHRRWYTPPARHCYSDLNAMCWLELMFPECTTVFSLESLLWVSALIMFLLLSPQTLQWVSREYSDTGGSDFSASEAAYGRLTLGSPAGMSTRIYVCLQWWKLLLLFFFVSLKILTPFTSIDQKISPNKGRASLQRGLLVWQRRSGVTLETTLTEHSVARTSRCCIVVIEKNKNKKKQQMQERVLTACSACTKFPSLLQKLDFSRQAASLMCTPMCHCVNNY